MSKNQVFPLQMGFAPLTPGPRWGLHHQTPVVRPHSCIWDGSKSLAPALFAIRPYYQGLCFWSPLKAPPSNPRYVAAVLHFRHNFECNNSKTQIQQFVPTDMQKSNTNAKNSSKNCKHYELRRLLKCKHNKRWNAATPLTTLSKTLGSFFKMLNISFYIKLLLFLF